MKQLKENWLVILLAGIIIAMLSWFFTDMNERLHQVELNQRTIAGALEVKLE